MSREVDIYAGHTEPPPADKKATAPTPLLSLTVPQFCHAHGISEAFYYKLKQAKRGPREMKVGARRMVSFEAAAKWRAAREKDAEAEAEAEAKTERKKA
jgi:predicted DNA-binding transcriptional regulator AlpA